MEQTIQQTVMALEIMQNEMHFFCLLDEIVFFCTWLEKVHGFRTALDSESLSSEDRQLVRMRMDYMDCSRVIHK